MSGGERTRAAVSCICQRLCVDAAHGGTRFALGRAQTSRASGKGGGGEGGGVLLS